MNYGEVRDITLSDILQTLWQYRRRCLVTAAVVAVAALTYAFVAPQTWEASQAIVVRDDMEARFGATGRPRNEDGLKDMQQTLLELTLSRPVLAAALKQVGPEPKHVSTTWPTAEDVDDVRADINLVAPKGAEFGKTEYFYLKVKARQQDRAIRLAEAIYAEVRKAFGELRAKVAASTIAELHAAVTLAEANLQQATQRLAQIERSVGVDLVALRMLHQSPNGDTALYRTLAATLDELRQSRSLEMQYNAILSMLRKAEDNPLLMSAAPKELLDCHPGLPRMIQGLSEARLRTAAGASKLTDEHPEMRAALREETGIQDGIRHELAAAIQGVTAAKAVATARRTTLETQANDLNQRLNRLTDFRAEYSNLVVQVEQRRTLLEECQKNLAQCRASAAAATSSSLLSQVSLPDGGIRPVSPSKKVIGLAGIVGGLLAGIGLVFLTAPISRLEEEVASLRLPRSSTGGLQPVRTGSDRVVWTRVGEQLTAESVR